MSWWAVAHVLLLLLLSVSPSFPSPAGLKEVLGEWEGKGVATTAPEPGWGLLFFP